MRFSLHSQGQEQTDTVCYFRMHTNQETVFSPFYPDRPTALEAMVQLVRRLRDGDTTIMKSRKGRPVGFTLALFGTKQPAVGAGFSVGSRNEGVGILADWQEAARPITFPLTFWELEKPLATPLTLRHLELGESDTQYAWREVGSSLVRVEEKRGAGFKPSFGIQAGLPGKCAPLFSALQPFVSADLPLFYGRKQAVEEVYALLQKRSLLLLYGAARVGKTSLLQCGLTNRVRQEEEDILVVRKKDTSLLVALRESLLEQMPASEAQPDDLDLLGLTKQFAAKGPGTPYLVFDQLEDLFQSEIFDEERQNFFAFIGELLTEEEVPCRIILVLREELLAAVAEFEEQLPALLDNRYRLLPMKEDALMDATVNLLDIFAAQNLLLVDEPETVAANAFSQLTNEKGEVPPHCLQIYLHQLHQSSCKETESGPVPIDPELMERFGPAPRLIDDFYAERINTLTKQRPSGDAPPNLALEREIAELERGRLMCGCGERSANAGGAAAVAPVPVVLPPWWLLLGLIALPLSLFAYWWFNDEEAPLTACELVLEEDTCSAYVEYLCTYGDSASCATAFRDSLERRDCELWRDYRLITELATCGAYQQFYAKYQDDGLCMDHVRARLLEWECPVVRGMVQLTVRDTVIRRVPVPTTFGGIVTPPTPADGPPCELDGNTNFKQVGPLWIMTDALPGGPYGWEDALDACTARGWRLPCIGEIDFLLAKIYRDNAGNAFANLTGTGECFLVNPATAPGGRIEFWTATEANDATAWSYYFDMPSKTIGRQSATPKSARLPCLCVQKNTDRQGSGLPPCYQKRVDRRSGE